MLGNKTLKTYSNVLSNLDVGKGTLYDMTDDLKKLMTLKSFISMINMEVIFQIRVINL